MKTIRFLALGVMLLFSITGYSTHLMGGEIVAQQISGYQYLLCTAVCDLTNAALTVGL